MNSYPPELITQLAPVMFVAGLDAAPTPSTPQSPTPSIAKGQQDAFAVLSARLRDALSSQRRVAVWQPEKSKSFQVTFVDKQARFPPRKIPPPDDQPSAVTHSPLSPLTPSSPLHPDGLIAPIWIRKHTTLVPSVFVWFMRLFESPPELPRSPLDAVDPDRVREREQEDRKRDTEVAAEIAQRKKSTSERAMKLTVVLLASRRMLDDPSLDARLTFIRRQGGLDSRAALFVLSPVSPSELTDFVRSLQEALYEPALEYYTAHSKRVRRKRNRHTTQSGIYPSAPPTPGGGIAPARPLRPEGWTVRYEYKMACFAEFRGEDEVALKHYQDAYGTLVIMFGSAAMLPPRTKRWAEAKVLVDTINIKVCKLYLYNNEHALALAHYNSHVRKFCDFSRGWGIGEETFEYWSWTARQYRVLAELLEQGTRTTLTIPSHTPAPPPPTPVVAAHQFQQQHAQRTGSVVDDGLQVPGLNPSQALHHPGYYYYMAARCTEQRREKFVTALEEEEAKGAGSSMPGFANERKVDHLTIILELYTRSYELFKKHSPSDTSGQGRLTLYIAYRIAQTYYESGKFDMAVRFFERIAKTYRREKWTSMLQPLLTTWYKCAQQMGDMELTVQLLIEMLGYGANIDDDDDSDVAEHLLAVLQSTVPSTPDTPLLIDLSEAAPILNVSVVFWTSEVKVDERAAFQISIRSRPGVSLASLPFASLQIFLSDDENATPLVVRHAGSESGDTDTSLQLVDVDHVEAPNGWPEAGVEADLRFAPGKTLVIAGTMSSKESGPLAVSRLLLTLKQSSWTIEIPQQPLTRGASQNLPFESSPDARWLSAVRPPRFLPITRNGFWTLNVHNRPHELHLQLSHAGTAYLDEDYPITVEVRNDDNRDLDVVINVLLQPSEADNAVNSITVDGEKSLGLIKDISLGVLVPGASGRKVLQLKSTGGEGDRVLDISVQSKLPGVAEVDHTPTPAPTTLTMPVTPMFPPSTETVEHLETLYVPTIKALTTNFSTSYRPSTKALPGPGDMRTFDDDFWDEGAGGEATVEALFQTVGDIELQSVSLVRKDSDLAKLKGSSLDDDADGWIGDWSAGDEYCDICRVEIGSEEHLQEELDGPGEYELCWKRILPDGTRGSSSISHFPLPSLRPPTGGLKAYIMTPSTARLHHPITMHLTVRNQRTSYSANCIVQVETDATDGFVLAGVRSGRLPILLPDAETSISWRLVPIECGLVRLPKVKVVYRRKLSTASEAGGEDEFQNVPMADVRWETRAADLEGVPGLTKENASDASDSDSGDDVSARSRIGFVLVLP